MTYIKGNYRKSIFTSDKGYVIGLFKIKETDNEELKIYINKIITFTGYFHELNLDDMYIFKGDVVEHPKYGLQFNVVEYERLKPADEDGLVAFLSSDLFKGIGERLAKSIVDTLGKNVLDEILKDESCLLLVPKMTSKKAHTIYETLMKYEESHQIIVYLTELGFNMKDALDIYNTYKSETIIHIEHNPYCLTDFISFLKVDEIALKLNIDAFDERRIKACIIYMMRNLLFTNSDTYLEYDEILESVFNYLKIDLNIDDFDLYLEELINENKIILLDNKYYLKEMYDSEINIINTIKYLENKKIDKLFLDNRIEELERVNNIKYNDKQKVAIKKSLENNITIITGGPGTGKTTIIKAICELYQNIFKLSYEELTNRIALLAPTGRASKRMSESTNLPASTIHRFLKWNKETNEFLVNEYNKNDHHLIIVDEVSMIDLNLLDSLFKGLTKNIKLVLVGDHHQLPSVGPGNILKDLIESDLIDTTYLDTLYRTDENSYITTLAHEIKDNNLSDSFLETKGDYTFLKCHSIKDNLKNLCLQLIAKGYDYKRVQIMAPMYAGVNGIDNLNKELQNIFNPKTNQNEIKYGDVIFRENDKILQLVNLPEENIYNGDIGIIKNIVKIENKTFIYIDFDGNLVKYETKDLNKITHGFVISIHKSQGSEFEVVIMLISNSYKRMLYKKLIYTGITRAKRKLILVGDPDAFLYAVNNNSEKNRKTNLLEQLKNNILNNG
ncbi:MAG TPA: ATP-dependent RecD-like DNA helicase [Candidatus Faecisoma merdavium]|nr:ATP-dependent RecD-like DNA helicase [Candidatus Faecisoma merdavium]